MAIPELTEYGYLPEGVHTCTLIEVEERFVTGLNNERKLIWVGLNRFLPTLAALKYNHLYINGSFTTSKALPNDIELIIELPVGEIASYYRQFHQNHDTIKRNYSVDFWPNFPELPQANDFTQFFQYIRTEEKQLKGMNSDSRKGILRLS